MNARIFPILIPILLLPSAAAAQWSTLDREREGAYAQIQLDLLTPLGDADDYWRTEIYGQLDFGVWGIQLGVPITMAMRENTRNEPVSGQFELGGFYQMAMKQLDLFFRLGLVLRAASDSPKKLAINDFGALARVTDWISHQSHVFGVRLGVSPVWDWDVFFLRLDLGTDFGFHDDERDPDAFARASLGLGARFSVLSMSLEVAAAGWLSHPRIGGQRPEFADLLRYQAAWTTWLRMGSFMPYLGVSAPLHEGALGEYLSVIVGLKFGTPY